MVIILNIFLYVSIKGRMDTPSKIVLAVYALSFILEAIVWIKYLIEQITEPDNINVDTVFGVLNSTSIQLIWIILYIFVYEMKTSEAFIRSKDLRELQKKQSRIKRNRYVVLSIVSPILITLIVISAIWNNGNVDFNKRCDAYPSIQYPDYIIRVIKMVVDIYMFVTFI